MVAYVVVGLVDAFAVVGLLERAGDAFDVGRAVGQDVDGPVGKPSLDGVKVDCVMRVSVSCSLTRGKDTHSSSRCKGRCP